MGFPAVTLYKRIKKNEILVPPRTGDIVAEWLTRRISNVNPVSLAVASRCFLEQETLRKLQSTFQEHIRECLTKHIAFKGTFV
jgi:hypothetical protein